MEADPIVEDADDMLIGEGDEESGEEGGKEAYPTTPMVEDKETEDEINRLDDAIVGEEKAAGVFENNTVSMVGLAVVMVIGSLMSLSYVIALNNGGELLIIIILYGLAIALVIAFWKKYMRNIYVAMIAWSFLFGGPWGALFFYYVIAQSRGYSIG